LWALLGLNVLVEISFIEFLLNHGYENWEEHGLRVFENRSLRTKFGHKREKVVRGWRSLHSEDPSGSG
jgi:hypothetical protein